MPFIYHRSEKDELVAGLTSKMRGVLWVVGLSPLGRVFLRSWPGARLGFPGAVLICASLCALSLPGSKSPGVLYR